MTAVTVLAASFAGGFMALPSQAIATTPLPESSCSAETDLASAAELQAATLSSQRGEPAKIQLVLDTAIAHWREAGKLCKDRAAERAQRNLAEALKLRAEVQEQTASAQRCDTPQRVARSFQDLAKAALNDRRFSEAAALFGKAEGSWDLAMERCSGPARQEAQKMRDQSVLDARRADELAKERAGSSASPTAAASKDVMLNAARAAVPAPAATGVAAAAAAALPVAPAVPTVLAPSAAAVPLLVTSAHSSNTNNAPPSAASPGVAAQAVKPVDTRLADGTRVTGQLVWDNVAKGFTGRGRFDWPNGDSYEGDMLKGLRHGQGKFTWRNGQVLTSHWESGKAAGLATLQMSNGDVFEGTVSDGVPDGRGTMRYASGDLYQGEMRQGQPHGKGVYTWMNRQRCDCIWVNGSAQGLGKLTFANGNEYQGALSGGLPNGKGQLSFSSGEVYQGDFVAGAFDGEGSYRWPNGDEYSGGWKLGRKEGKGVMSWTKGERWEGVYKNDEQAEGQLTRRLKRRPAAASAASSPVESASAASSPAR